MSGFPPYPQPGSPFNGRQQARMAREQIRAQVRAQKAAFRAQRELIRYQTRGLRRTSILGPVIILSIGVIVLLVRLGRVPSTTFWNWYGHWWPMLLVAAGVILVAEWAFDQLPRPEGVPYVRRGIGAGAIFLLLGLAATGAGVEGAHSDRIALAKNFNIDPDTWSEFFGEKHESTQNLDATLPSGGSISIDNPHGDVAIVGESTDNQVHIVVNKQVFSSSDSEADSKAQRLSPRVETIGNALSITVPALDGASADLAVTIPAAGETTVNANHGDITITGVRAPVNVTANHGDIALKSIGGTVSAHINHRDSTFSAHNVTGDLYVHGHADDMNVSGVSGQVTLEGEFYGDTHLEQVRGATSFRTSRTQLSLARLDGQLDISPDSDLTASQIVGPATLRTRSRNINFDRVAGDVDITNSDGSVDIVSVPEASSGNHFGSIAVTNKNGEVNVTVPQHSGLIVDAQTKGGDIESDFDLKTISEHNMTSLQGTVGAGGPKLMIRTTHLNIGLHEKPEAPLAPLAPLPPPPAPSAPTRPSV
jgi:DUF4097 and DUF4098 domain-containing protein YvlB